MIGALIARLRPGGPTHTRRIEYDTLYGPRPDMVDGRRPRPGCYCQTASDLIKAVRSQRVSQQGADT
jgi:hypothetical protein